MVSIRIELHEAIFEICEHIRQRFQALCRLSSRRLNRFLVLTV